MLHYLFIIFSLAYANTASSRVENLKDLVLYRFGSTGVVQALSRAAELLGLVPVFPVRNVHTLSSGSGGGGGNAVFRDCVLVRKYVFCSWREKEIITENANSLSVEIVLSAT